MSERTPTEAPSAPAAAAPTDEEREVGSPYWLRRHATSLQVSHPHFKGICLEMFGAADRYERLAARYEELEQTTAELCEDCGWRMRFPGEECANCERYRLRARYEEVIEALREIADSPHCAYPETATSDADRQYGIGVADGHRCAANTARKFLARHEESRTTGERSED